MWKILWRVLPVICIFLTACERSESGARSAPDVIQFLEVPPAQSGDPNRFVTISGRAVGARPDQQIVLYAKTETTWYVQPFVDRPFTKIQSDSTWRNSIHPGFEYAALLVSPGYRVTAKTDVLPTQGVTAYRVTRGIPPFWQRWWFVLICVILALSGAVVLHRLRLKQLTERLNVRFEERLGERMRVAQILHDTLLQGVISSSMQLHVALAELPSGSTAHDSVNHVLQSLGKVVEEGRTTLKGLSASTESVTDLRRSFLRIPHELNMEEDLRFHVEVKGPAFPLQPAVRVGLYGIGREALMDAARDGSVSDFGVEMRYSVRGFRLRLRHDGAMINEASLKSLRERAEKIGARVKVRRRMMGGLEIKVKAPSNVAFESHPSPRSSGLLRRFHE